MNLFILISLLTFSLMQADKADLGSFKYSIFPSAQLEHPFYHSNFEQIDFLFSYSPFKKIQKEDSVCNWTQKDMGIQQIVDQLTYDQSGDSYVNYPLCPGNQMCYITVGRNLYLYNESHIIDEYKSINKTIILPPVIKSISIPFPDAKIFDLSSFGLLGLYNKKDQIKLLDITKVLYEQNSEYILDDLLKKSLYSSISALSNLLTYTLYVNVGQYVEIWNVEQIHKIHKIGEIYMDGVAYTKQQIINKQANKTYLQSGLKEMKIENNLLFLFSSLNGLLIFEISDPFQIHQMNIVIDQEDKGSASPLQSFRKMNANMCQLTILHFAQNLKIYKIFHYQIIFDKNNLDSIRLNLVLSGQIDLMTFGVVEKSSQVNKENQEVQQEDKVQKKDKVQQEGEVQQEVQTRFNKINLLVLLIIFLVAMLIFIEWARKNCQSQTVKKNLFKSNQNLENETKERIRITHNNIDHTDEDSEEWRVLSRQQQDFPQDDAVIQVENEENL